MATSSRRQRLTLHCSISHSTPAGRLYTAGVYRPTYAFSASTQPSGREAVQPRASAVFRGRWVGLNRVLLRFPLILIVLPVLAVAAVLVAVPLAIVAYVALIRTSIRSR
jgi:hypothetical protein